MDQTEKKPTRRSGLKEILGRNISIRLPLDLYDRIDLLVKNQEGLCKYLQTPE